MYVVRNNKEAIFDFWKDPFQWYCKRTKWDKEHKNKSTIRREDFVMKVENDEVDFNREVYTLGIFIYRLSVQMIYKRLIFNK